MIGAAAFLAATLTLFQTGPAPAIDSRRMAVLAAEENRAELSGQLAALAEATRSDSAEVQAAAARALGRLERRDVIAVLLPLLSARDADVRAEAATAIAQSFRGAPLPEPISAEHVQAVQAALMAAPRSGEVYRSLGRLPYETADQVRAAEAFIRNALPHVSAARGLESIARLHRKLAPLGEETLDQLRIIASRAARTEPPDARRNAMAALVASQGADEPTVEAALRDEEFEIRRLAVLVLGGAGNTFSPEQRAHLLNLALQDRSPAVRLEAVRVWARRASDDNGCAPLTNALADTDLHVVAAALDALGDQCKADDQITDRLTAESRTPPTVGPWQREAHAFVALAKRSRERAAVAMSSFAMHNDWQVRMYAARAAAAMDDADTLVRLAADPDDNVVEAALPALRQLLKSDSDIIFVSALERRNRTVGRDAPARAYQVIRVAALQLRGAVPTPRLVAAVSEALARTTADRCMTSRDVRLALIARLVEFGDTAQTGVLMPLLRDIDPAVASAAANGIAAWTGKRPPIEPQKRQPDVPSQAAVTAQPLVSVEMESGQRFYMAFYPNQALLTKARFLQLVEDRYYDNLTFHRVVPNFVIQGGSPNANEYCGDCPFMRDERGLLMHVRGTVGVSTRGRDTGDAQFFVNLVDNARLDHDYTVFAYVCADQMKVVDEIHEGDRMRRVAVATGVTIRCEPPR
jgi:cyclophilin family peptidyl-prolyl cis-trans isomerase/HEAT repeat protein